MSTLQLSLAIIGGLVLALIVAYNTWTSRRNAPKRALPQDSEHAAEPALRQEPGFDAGAAGAMPPSEFHGLDRGPEPSEHTVDAGDALQLPVPPFSPERRPGLDPLIDVIASLQPEHVVSADAALAALPPTRRAGSKPFAIEGLNEATQQWETPVPGQRYQSFQAGVQLANRMGPLNEIEFSEFVMKVQTFADALGAAVELPDMLSEVARARELDQFAGQHDAQLSFMLRPTRAAWSPGYIAQHASALGFVTTNMPGRLHLPSPQPGQAPLLILSFDAQAAQAEDLDRTAVYELYLSLDVPQVPREQQPFTHLCNAVQSLAQSMDGIVCDPDGNPLPPQALEQVGQQLEGVYASLAAHEVAAGSMLACRLFS